MAKSLRELEENYTEAKTRYDKAIKKDSDGVSGYLTKWVVNSYNKAKKALEKARMLEESKGFNDSVVEEFLNTWSEKAKKFMSEKEVEKEVERKRVKFYSLIIEKAGKILSANLRIGKDGNINGFVEGSKSCVRVETIIAGGYNIQCLHYRVLVK